MPSIGAIIHLSSSLLALQSCFVVCPNSEPGAQMSAILQTFVLDELEFAPVPKGSWAYNTANVVALSNGADLAANSRGFYVGKFDSGFGTLIVQGIRQLQTTRYVESQHRLLGQLHGKALLDYRDYFCGALMFWYTLRISPDWTNYQIPRRRVYQRYGKYRSSLTVAYQRTNHTSF
jgi:hypothetical protein